MPCRLHAGGQGSDTTIVRYIMPDDSSFILQQDAVYILDINSPGPMDIAPATSLLWMIVDDKVSLNLHAIVIFLVRHFRAACVRMLCQHRGNDRELASVGLRRFTALISPRRHLTP